MSLLAYLVLGLVAGLIMKGSGSGVLGNLISGVIGVFIGGYLFDFYAVDSSGLIESLITATLGGILLLIMVGSLKRDRIPLLDTR
ncbi:MAG: GlsB/YeaQ/YmgE family stress response membrane protein [Candidatus Thiodiazotropha sp. (ex Codakia rugifera)]|nr:GlsB/YeaQ/YmgE family stress response membrane protein [Candidatus Thiodiazotropha sp. (ex Codakia rugifera)]